MAEAVSHLLLLLMIAIVGGAVGGASIGTLIMWLVSRPAADPLPPDLVAELELRASGTPDQGFLDGRSTPVAAAGTVAAVAAAKPEVAARKCGPCAAVRRAANKLFFKTA